MSVFRSKRKIRLSYILTVAIAISVTIYYLIARNMLFLLIAILVVIILLVFFHKAWWLSVSLGLIYIYFWAWLPNVVFSLGIFSITFLDLVWIFFGFIPWIVWHPSRHHDVIVKSGAMNYVMFYCIGNLVLGSLVGFLSGNNPKYIFQDMRGFLFAMIAYIMVRLWLQRSEGLRTIVVFLIVLTFLGGISALIIRFSLWSPWRGDIIVGTGVEYIRTGIYEARTACKGLLLAIALFLYSIKRDRRLLLIIAIIVGTLPIIISGTRYPYIALLIGFAVFLPQLIRDRKFGKLAALVIPLIFVAIAGQFILSTSYKVHGTGEKGLAHFMDRILSTRYHESSIEGRFIEGAIALSMIKKSPLFGNGLGFVRPVSYLEPVYSRYQNDRSVHIGYLNLGMRTGLFGLSLLAILLFVFLRQSWKTFIATKGTSWFGVGLGLLPMALILPVVSFFEFGFVGSIYLTWFTILLAILESTESHAKKSI